MNVFGYLEVIDLVPWGRSAPKAKKWRGVQNPKDFANILNGCPLGHSPIVIESIDPTSLLLLPTQVIEALDADCIDESEVLTCADELHHIDKRAFNIPFVCGAKGCSIHI